MLQENVPGSVESFSRERNCATSSAASDLRERDIFRILKRDEREQTQLQKDASNSRIKVLLDNTEEQTYSQRTIIP